MNRKSEKKRHKYTGRNSQRQFLAIPHDVLKSSEFAALDGGQLKMLIDLAALFNGKNNGNLDLTQLEMRWSAEGKPGRAGTAELKPAHFPGARWNSERKKQRCLKALISKGWLIKTKQGGFGIGPNLFAVSWWPIDECNGRHDYPTETVPSHLWKKKSAAPEAGSLNAPETGALVTMPKTSNAPGTGVLGLVSKVA